MPRLMDNFKAVIDPWDYILTTKISMDTQQYQRHHQNPGTELMHKKTPKHDGWLEMNSPFGRIII